MFQEKLVRLFCFKNLSGFYNREKSHISESSKQKIVFVKDLNNTAAENHTLSHTVRNSEAEIKTNPLINHNSQDEDVIEQSLGDNAECKPMHLERKVEIESQLAKPDGEYLKRKKNGKSKSCNETGEEQNYQRGRGQEAVKMIDLQNTEDDDDIFAMNDFSKIDECILEAYNCTQYNCGGQELVLTFFERQQRIARPTEDFDQFCKMIDRFCSNNVDEDQENENIVISDDEMNNEEEIEKDYDGDMKETEQEEEKEDEEKYKKGAIEQNQNNDIVEKNNDTEESSPCPSDDFEVIKIHSLEITEKLNKQRRSVKRSPSRMFSINGNLIGMDEFVSMESIFYEFSRGEVKTDQTITEENPKDVEVGIRYKKISLIKELISTEKNYIAGLGRVVYDYMPHLKMNEPLGLKGKWADIFGNITEIYYGAKAFFESLQNCARDDVEGIADAFITFVPIFDLYTKYAKNKPIADSCLPKFQQIYEAKQVELNDKIDLLTYLITPIQRLGQYVTLLHSMQKEMVKERENVTKITKAVELIKHIMKKGNDLMTIDSIKLCPVDLTKKGSLIMGEEFLVLKPESYQAKVFLFEHIIVFSKISSKTTAEYIYLTSMDTTNLKVDSHNDDPLIFQLSNYFPSKADDFKKYTFRLKAPSERIKKLWTGNVEKLLWQQLEEAKTAHQNEIQLLRDEI